MGQDSVAKTDHWQHAERWCVAETKRETSPARGAVARLRAQLCHGESGLAQWDNHCTVREGEREEVREGEEKNWRYHLQTAIASFSSR